MSISSLINSNKAISTELGILNYVVKFPRMNNDPLLMGYGIWPSDTSFLGGEKYGGRSSGCGYEWQESLLGTIGETVERYAPAFYDVKERIFSSYKDLGKNAIHPSEYALFHDKQHEDSRFGIKKFDENVEVSWFPTHDLTSGETVYCPGQFIFLPFTMDKNWINSNTSTGLSAHTNYYKALLGGLYEVIERDSFVMTWMQSIVPPKIIIDQKIQDYLDSYFPKHYQWHFFDVTYDLEVPTVFGFCFGETEYGEFVAVGSSTRSTMGDALKKVIQEIGQAIPYFRYLLGEKKDWQPSDDFNEIRDFEQHSIFYLKRKDLWHVFDKWIDAEQNRKIDFHESQQNTPQEEIKRIVKILKDKNYNVLVKDLTTPDIRQIGFYSVKVFVPQLLQMAGIYPFYFSGGKRLYEVPAKLGYVANDYDNLNKYPHPFP